MFKRKSMLLVLSVLLVFSIIVSACGSENEETPSSTEQQETNEPVNEPAAEPVIDPMAKYDPPIELTTVGISNTSTKYNEGDSKENNNYTRGYEKELGIKVKYDWYVPGDQYNTKINVTIASNDLPDLFGVDATQLKQLIESGKVEDLSTVLEQYATPLTKEVLNSDGGAALNAASVDGKLYAIPEIHANTDASEFLWVRTDWLKKLNLSEPKTMDDVYKISEAFTNQDPDGNNKKDTVGLGLEKSLYNGYGDIYGFANGFHAYPRDWMSDSSGQLVYGSIQPEMKAVLAKLHEMYKNGQIDQEFAVIGGEKLAEEIVSGKVGMFFGQMWNAAYPLQDAKNKEPNSDWMAYPIPSIDSKTAMTRNPFNTNNYFAVRKGMQNPEAAIKLLNFFIEKNYSANADTKNYNNSSENNHYQDAVILTQDAQRQLKGFAAIQEALETNDPSKVMTGYEAVYADILKFRSGDISGWGMERVYGPESSFKWMKYYDDNKLFKLTEFYGAPTPTMVEKKSSLEKLEDETFTKIIYGQIPIDEFDKFVEDWKKLGGDKITQEVNELKKQQ